MEGVRSVMSITHYILVENSLWRLQRSRTQLRTTRLGPPVVNTSRLAGSQLSLRRHPLTP